MRQHGEGACEQTVGQTSRDRVGHQRQRPAVRAELLRVPGCRPAAIAGEEELIDPWMLCRAGRSAARRDPSVSAGSLLLGLRQERALFLVLCGWDRFLCPVLCCGSREDSRRLPVGWGRRGSIGVPTCVACSPKILLLAGRLAPGPGPGESLSPRASGTPTHRAAGRSGDRRGPGHRQRADLVVGTLAPVTSTTASRRAGSRPGCRRPAGRCSSSC